MAYHQTKLNPAAPSFPAVEPLMMPQTDMPPTPPPEESLRSSTDAMSTNIFDITTLPDWALVEENEKLRVAALTLAKTSTRGEWIDRLQKFANLLAPGICIGSATDAEGGAAWKPLAVRQMPPPLQPNLTTHGATFSFEFLQNELQGVEWSPGFYYIHPKDRRDDCKFTAYWILDADLDPYLPKVPGEHGAKLTPFFNSTLSEQGTAPGEEDYLNTPVFIGDNFKSDYRYFGHYSQNRFSDKLDYERMVDGTIPPFVLNVWAKNLTQADTQPWVRDALREHIWPKPTYYGPLPLSSASGSRASNGSLTPAKDAAKAHDRRVQRAMKRFTEELQEWEIDSKLKFSLLKEADIHRLFHAADSDAEIGLRFWFEYLQCTSYEESLYERLVELKFNEHLQRRHQAKLTELLKKGWRWKAVEKVSGSGHTQMARKLCPPPQKATALLARKDSVVGDAQELRAVKSGEPKSKRSEVFATTIPELLQGEYADAAPQDKPCNTASQRQADKTLPPHLRGKAGNKPASPTTTQEAKPTALATTTAEPTKTTSLRHGDLEAAKRMAASFTKAGARRGGSFAFANQAKPPSQAHIPNRAGPQQTVDRSDPMDYGWARVGRNPKVVEVDGHKDAVW